MTQLTPDTAIAEALKDNQFISIQDTNHGSMAVRDGLAKLVPMLAKNGVKHIFVEMFQYSPLEAMGQDLYSLYDSDTPRKPQPQEVINWFLSGQVSRHYVKRYFTENPQNMWTDAKAIEKYAETETRLLEECKKYGIKVWGSDPQTMFSLNTADLLWNHLPQLKLLMDMVPEIGKIANEDTCNMKNLDQLLPPEMFGAEEKVLEGMPAFVHSLLKGRMDVNDPVVDYASEHTRDNKGRPEKAAFFWGRGHSSNMIGNRDIDEFAVAVQQRNGFPGKKVHNVAVFGSRAAKVCDDELKQQSKSSGDDTAYFYYVTEHAAERNDKHSETPAFKSYEELERYMVAEIQKEKRKQQSPTP